MVDGWSFVKNTDSHIQVQEGLNEDENGKNPKLYSLAGNIQNA